MSALVIGGGPAGSTAAIMLARAGVATELVERNLEPSDVVCGGFLGWDALAGLEKLGIDVGALGAHPVRQVRLASSDTAIEVALPGPAVGLSRRTLDKALLNAAFAAGVQVTRGRSVREVDASTRSARLDNGRELMADALFLATGKHELRGGTRSLSEYHEAPSVGCRATLPPSIALEKALRDTIELHVFDGGYAGLLLQEDGSTNLCVSISRSRLTAAGSIPQLIESIAARAPLLAERMAASPTGPWKAVAGVPYGWRTSATTEGIFRLGDQCAVISSLAGDGVAIAIRSASAAASAYLRDGSGGAHRFQKRFARRSTRPLAIADALRRAADAEPSRRMLIRLAGVPSLTRLAARLTRIG